jgi:hypothetical protein
MLQFCHDLGVDPMDVALLVLSYKVRLLSSSLAAFVLADS